MGAAHNAGASLKCGAHGNIMKIIARRGAAHIEMVTLRLVYLTTDTL